MKKYDKHSGLALRETLQALQECKRKLEQDFLHITELVDKTILNNIDKQIAELNTELNNRYTEHEN